MAFGTRFARALREMSWRGLVEPMLIDWVVEKFEWCEVTGDAATRLHALSAKLEVERGSVYDAYRVRCGDGCSQ